MPDQRNVGGVPEDRKVAVVSAADGGYSGKKYIVRDGYIVTIHNYQRILIGSVPIQHTLREADMPRVPQLNHSKIYAVPAGILLVGKMTQYKTAQIDVFQILYADPSGAQIVGAVENHRSGDFRAKGDRRAGASRIFRNQRLMIDSGADEDRISRSRLGCRFCQRAPWSFFAAVRRIGTILGDKEFPVRGRVWRNRETENFSSGNVSVDFPDSDPVFIQQRFFRNDNPRIVVFAACQSIQIDSVKQFACGVCPLRHFRRGPVFQKRRNRNRSPPFVTFPDGICRKAGQFPAHGRSVSESPDASGGHGGRTGGRFRIKRTLQPGGFRMIDIFEIVKRTAEQHRICGIVNPSSRNTFQTDVFTLLQIQRIHFDIGEFDIP